MYKGDIYKTRNLRNLSLMQMFPDPDDLKHAQDSIENRLRAFDRNLWVPTREGNEQDWRMAVAMTRHTAEVDCYHAGPHAGLGSRLLSEFGKGC